MRALGSCVVCVALLVGACSSQTPEVLKLDRGRLTVNNQTDEEWRNVEIWVNNYYRALVPSIAPKGLLQGQLHSFISRYGQRFDFRRGPGTELRLSDRRPTAESVELKQAFPGHH